MKQAAKSHGSKYQADNPLNIADKNREKLKLSDHNNLAPKLSFIHMQKWQCNLRGAA